MHPSLRGQIALAQAVLSALRCAAAFRLATAAPVPTIDPARVCRAFWYWPRGVDSDCRMGGRIQCNRQPAALQHSERKQRIEAFGAAKAKIEQGIAPEDVGWPNLGIPAAVPVVPYHSEGGALRQRLE